MKEFSQTKGEVRATEGSRLVHFSFSGQSEWTSFSVQEDLCAERHTHKLPSGMSVRTEVPSDTPRAQGCLFSPTPHKVAWGQKHRVASPTWHKVARCQKYKVACFSSKAQGCLRSKAQGCLFSLQGTRLLEVESTRLLVFPDPVHGCLSSKAQSCSRRGAKIEKRKRANKFSWECHFGFLGKFETKLSERTSAQVRKNQEV